MSLYDSLQATIQEVINNSSSEKIININFNHYENSTIYNNGLNSKGDGLNINIDNINTPPDISTGSADTQLNIDINTNSDNYNDPDINLNSENTSESTSNYDNSSNSESSSNSDTRETLLIENNRYIFPSEPFNYSSPTLPLSRPPSSLPTPSPPPLPPPPLPIRLLNSAPPPEFPHGVSIPISSITSVQPNSILNDFPIGVLDNSTFTFDFTDIDEDISALTNNFTNISNSLRETINETLNNIGVGTGVTVKETVNNTQAVLYKDINLENKETACPVCNEDYDEISICRINNKCNHFFHIDCIDNWYSASIKCPTCNQIIL